MTYPLPPEPPLVKTGETSLLKLPQGQTVGVGFARELGGAVHRSRHGPHRGHEGKGPHGRECGLVEDHAARVEIAGNAFQRGRCLGCNHPRVAIKGFEIVNIG